MTNVSPTRIRAQSVIHARKLSHPAVRTFRGCMEWAAFAACLHLTCMSLCQRTGGFLGSSSTSSSSSSPSSSYHQIFVGGIFITTASQQSDRHQLRPKARRPLCCAADVLGADGTHPGTTTAATAAAWARRFGLVGSVEGQVESQIVKPLICITSHSSLRLILRPLTRLRYAGVRTEA